MTDERMRLYFDTNVYRFISDRNEQQQVRALLDVYDCTLVASSENLFETYAIPIPLEQRAEIENLVRLADHFEERPVSWLHATELLAELRRLRPNWIRSISFARAAKVLLRGHRQRWKEACGGKLPDPNTYAAFRHVWEGGVAKNREFQRILRLNASDAGDFGLISPRGEPLAVNISDAETYWRMSGLMVWYSAIEGHAAGSRDYADWLSPYLKMGAFDDDTYAGFWLKDAADQNMPLNRVTGLVDFYQLEEKITHGNATDQLHASQWLLSNMFFTADQAFYRVLRRVADQHFPERAKPVLLDRSSGSCVQQLESILYERLRSAQLRPSTQ